MHTVQSVYKFIVSIGVYVLNDKTQFMMFVQFCYYEKLYVEACKLDTRIKINPCNISFSFYLYGEYNVTNIYFTLVFFYRTRLPAIQFIT